MAENKTQKTEQSVESFLSTIDTDQKRNDSVAIIEIMQKVTGEAPKMWGTSIIGFGDLHYKYASGREGDWFKTGLSPRKAAITVYLSGGFDRQQDLLATLGKHKTGKGCLYINKLSDVNVAVLEQMLVRSVESSEGG